MSQDINIKNKKASYEYHFIETYSAGMVLTGTEIKSIRQSKASIVEAYCYFVGNELFVKNMHIADYDKASFFKHDPKQDRKLLLNKQELKKLKKATQIKGQTIIPTRIFINESGYAKLDIALAKGKKIYDKREDLKTKDAKRDLDRAIAD